MSESQLREAYTLMKQGDKQNATRLVQDLLSQDKSNVNAWWLFAHLLEDEAKIVSALENVLAQNPEHLGARKKLSELRPEYADLYQATSTEKAKNGEGSHPYWDKLNTTTPKKKAFAKSSSLGLNIAMLFLAFVLFVMAVGIFAFIIDSKDTSSIESESSPSEPLAELENTPIDVAKAFNEAYYREDVPRLYALSCESYHSHIEEMLKDFDSSNPEAITVDYTETEFELDKANSNERYAYVSLHGSTFIRDGGISLRTDWDALAEANGYEYYGFDLENIDGTWKICYQK